MEVKMRSLVVGYQAEQEPKIIARKEVIIESGSAVEEIADQDLPRSVQKVGRRTMRIETRDDLVSLNKRLRGGLTGEATTSGAGLTSRSPSA